MIAEGPICSRNGFSRVAKGLRFLGQCRVLTLSLPVERAGSSRYILVAIYPFHTCSVSRLNQNWTEASNRGELGTLKPDTDCWMSTDGYTLNEVHTLIKD